MFIDCAIVEIRSACCSQHELTYPLQARHTLNMPERNSVANAPGHNVVRATCAQRDEDGIIDGACCVMRRGVSVYSSAAAAEVIVQKQAADARVSGLTLNPSAASVPMPAKRHDGTVRPHQVPSSNRHMYQDVSVL